MPCQKSIQMSICIIFDIITQMLMFVSKGRCIATKSNLSQSDIPSTITKNQNSYQESSIFCRIESFPGPLHRIQLLLHFEYNFTIAKNIITIQHRLAPITTARMNNSLTICDTGVLLTCGDSRNSNWKQKQCERGISHTCK